MEVEGLGKHTPGPWAFIEHFADNLSIVAEDDRQPKAWKAEHYGVTAERPARTLAQINWMVVRGIGYQEAEANARLMSAAPELLEACKRIVQEEDATGEVTGGAIEDCQSAIRKAEER